MTGDLVYTKEQKDRAKKDGTVLFKSEFDARHLVSGWRRRQWGPISMSKAERILAILDEEEAK